MTERQQQGRAASTRDRDAGGGPAAAPSETTGRRFPVPGLVGPVEILIDRWGVPHIYAEDRLDAFLAQGFQVARDRLFQIDLWRRRGLGELAEVLGPDHLEGDRARRLFLYRGDMRAEWLAYGAETKDIVTAFVRGINAFIDWAAEDAETRLPVEFGRLGYAPARWEPEDVVRIRTHGLQFNVAQELERALTLRDLGEEAESFRSVREPETGPQPFETELIDRLSDDALDVFKLAYEPVALGDAAASVGAAPSGSNNWVISGSSTETGRPILANDPHRMLTLPSLRYLAHLEAPGLSIIGAGEPNLPGIYIGHNGRVAFGLTIWPADQEDLYVYELHPEDPDRYRYRDDWRSFTTIEETAPVAGGGEAVHVLRFGVHGPVVHHDAGRGVALAVRAASLEPGTAPYLGSVAFFDSADADDHHRALRRWSSPPTNQIFADVHGRTGWQGSALVPRRRGWDGSLPVAGDGRFEWEGFASLEELPSDRKLATGWFASANENNVPDSHDSGELSISADWFSNARARRLQRRLASGESRSVDSSWRLQEDAANEHALAMLERLAPVEVDAAADIWAELRAWDGVERVDSRCALVFQVWQRRHFRPWLVDRSLARAGCSAEAVRRGRHRLLRDDALFSDLRPDLRMLDRFDLAEPADLELMAEGVAETLEAALDEIEGLLGPNRSGWAWGELHRTRLRHPLYASAAPGQPEWAALPEVPRAGSGDTVGLAGYDAEFNAVMGSSFRMVLDVGEWDESRVLNSPGQSGDPRSNHYADLQPLWAAGTGFPLLYSREAVLEAAEERIRLSPR